MRVLVTGASGHLGSAVVPELLAAGHEVHGLARSDASAAAISALGATPRRGDLDDLDGLRQAAADSDGVVHLAFKHDLMLTGDMAGAIAAEIAVVQALGDGLAGSGKPLVAASGTGSPGPLDRPGTELDPAVPGGRPDAEIALLALAERNVRASAVRLPPIVHSELDRHGFATIMIGTARRQGVSGYAGDGANRWPAVHTLDAARVFRLALEKAPAGTSWHAVGDEGIAVRDLARTIGEHLGVPTESIPADKLQEHFGFLTMLINLDFPSSNLETRRVLGWEPAHPGLLADLEVARYFDRPESER